jgi:hypothetical protein
VISLTQRLVKNVRAKMQTASESRPFVTANIQFPATVQNHCRKNQPINQVTSRRAVPCLTNPPLVPERQSSRRKVDLKGFEPSPFPWQGTVLPITPQAHAESLRQRDTLVSVACENLPVRVSFRDFVDPHGNASSHQNPETARGSFRPKQVPHRAFGSIRNDITFGCGSSVKSSVRKIQFLNRCHAEPARSGGEEPVFASTLSTAGFPHCAAKSSHVGFF